MHIGEMKLVKPHWRFKNAMSKSIKTESRTGQLYENIVTSHKMGVAARHPSSAH